MILVINKNRREACASADIFYYMGILSLGVCPEEAFSEIGLEYRAVMVMFPELMADAHDYMKRLRKYTGKIPTFAITREPSQIPTEYFERVFDYNTLSSTVMKKITKFCEENNLPYAGSYRTAGIDASADTEKVFFGNSEIILTKTEKMILRYLIRTYPAPSAPAKILKHAFRQTRAPLVTSVRTHISQINKKFRTAAGICPIERIESLGYVLSCPKTL